MTSTAPQFADKTIEDLSLLGRWASIALRDQIAEIQKDIPVLPNPKNRNVLIPIADTLFHHGQQVSKERKFKVCIIGAGAAGLFTGMILDHLKEVYKLDVEYEILEASDEERVGGRLYSHYFTKPARGGGNHEYYEVGAMRYPESRVMKPTFSLFQALDMKEYSPSSTEIAEEGWKPKPGNLVRYYLQGLNTVEMYNDIQLPIPSEGPTTSTAQSFNITGLQPYDAMQTPSSLIEKQIKDFTDRLKKDPQDGWRYLISTADVNSVRQFFLNKLDWDTTEWLETYSYGTAWYDQALSEMILESVNFDHDGKWWCIEGGSQEMAKRMYAKVENKESNRVSFSKKVTKMEYLFRTGNDPNDQEKIGVHVAGEEKYREYDAVFNSVPLGSMQRMDLRGLNLNWGTKQAIRSLGYGASCKVGIRFKEMWWMTKLGINGGGVSKTDLPIRMCIYPSYNIHDNDPDPKDPKKEPKNVPGVLLCSYSWSMEAQRLGTLIDRNSPQGEAELKALLLDNLARLHANEQWPYERLHALISSLYDTHFAYDWYADKGTTGAFAYFGPGQFQKMYPYIVRNDGAHIIIGEAASAHHAWVVGALESAIRGVYQFLYKHSEHSECNAALQAYNEGKVAAPYGPIPAEFDRTKDVQPLNAKTEKIVTDIGKEEAKLVSGNGEWLRQGVQYEKWRLQQGGDRLIPQDVGKAQVEEFTVLVK